MTMGTAIDITMFQAALKTLKWGCPVSHGPMWGLPFPGVLFWSAFATVL